MNKKELLDNRSNSQVMASKDLKIHKVDNSKSCNGVEVIVKLEVTHEK